MYRCSCGAYVQCFRSALVSVRIRIQHFRRKRIRIQIQGFDDQKRGKNYSSKTNFVHISLEWSRKALEALLQPSYALIQFLMDPDAVLIIPDPQYCTYCGPSLLSGLG
jgi:hypothetical protein